LSLQVATVAGQPISVGLLDERIARMRLGPRGRQMPPSGAPGYADMCRWVVRELVTESIVAHEIRLRRLTHVSQLVLAVTQDVTVSDVEVRSYYERNLDLYRRGATVIAFDDAAAAIEEDLLVAERLQAFDLWLEGRRHELAVVEPPYEHPADPRYGFPSHRH
jgi:[acyl-carrier-protein] S-malonyltransferase